MLPAAVVSKMAEGGRGGNGRFETAVVSAELVNHWSTVIGLLLCSLVGISVFSEDGDGRG